MPRVTLSLDDETARWARVRAAELDMSVSKYVSELLRSEMADDDAYERARRSYLSASPTPFRSSPDERYPPRREVHER